MHSVRRGARRPARRSPLRDRRGSLLPALVVALLVALGGVALVLNHLWLESAAREMDTAAEAAARAAARDLVSDELLQAEPDWGALYERATSRAQTAAAANLVVGKSLDLAPGPDGDVAFGRLVNDPQTGRDQFVRVFTSPDRVVVRARRARSLGNAIPLLLTNARQPQAGDVALTVAVGLDPHVVALRPLAHVAVPAWPLAILESDPTGTRSDTWQTAVVQRGGADQYAFDSEAGDVRDEADGLPELVLTGSADGATSGAGTSGPTTANVRTLDLGTRLADDALAAQATRGIALGDLDALGGRLAPELERTTVAASPVLPEALVESLSRQIGQVRIVLRFESPSGTDANSVRLVHFAAVRLMAVNRTGDGFPQLVVQPAAIATPTAVLDDELSDDERGTVAPTGGDDVVGADPLVAGRHVWKIRRLH